MEHKSNDALHNKANEITDISGEQADQVAWATPAYDAMGNVTSYPKPSAMSSSYTCKYDAWNRLTEVKDGANLVGAYSYDGLGRRITKKTYVSGQLDKTRQFFYTQQWQIIEERVDGRTNPQERQYVWGIGYVDELVLRDRDSGDDTTLDQRHYALQDANYSLTCIVDTNGEAAERYTYTPYGTRSILDGIFGSLSASACDWNIGHQGLMHDTNTSLIYNRARMLHPGLGRFMQRDPFEYADGMSLYQYAGSSPCRLTDPSGQHPIYYLLALLPFIVSGDESRLGDEANCDCFAFMQGKEMMPEIIAEAIAAGILQGFGKDVDDTLGGTYLDKGSGKLQAALEHYFNEHPEKGFKLKDPSGSCPGGYVKVAAETYDPSILYGRDYHFYRYDPRTGIWRHKLRGERPECSLRPWIKRDSDPQGVYCVRVPQ
ncbi:RHS repeat domain-containing protein [Fontivita pretiosa]|uniref:RHS repeat domain-containing protein n=1 Tax=Fontivita pretiosa TaxID=2989684 RepID=UPI003D17F3E7